MSQGSYVLLEERGIVAVEGEDARGFLQGLVSNDVDEVSTERAVYAALLTPQGKYLHDFFMVEMAGAVVLDSDGGRVDDLLKRLGIYKLRAKVSLSVRQDDVVAAVFGEGAGAALGLGDEPGRAAPFGGGVAFTDPRLAAAGARVVLPRNGAEAALEGAGLSAAAADDYDLLRMGLGLPDGARDMPVEKAILMENGFDELHGIAWDKGCYVGQELTARTKHRGIVRKRLVPVEIEGPTPKPGTPLVLEGKDAGEMRSGRDGMGLALIRLEHLDRAERAGAAFSAGDAWLTPKRPAWADF